MNKTRESLESKVAKWVNNQGYRLEFDVAKVFTDVGFQTTLGSYLSSFSLKRREVDVLGTRCVVTPNPITKKNSGLHPKIQLCVAVECKYVQDKPWVLLGETPVFEPRGVPPYIPRAAGLASDRSPTVARKRNSISPGKLLVSHGLVQSKLGDKTRKSKEDQNTDIAYQAVVKVVEQSWVFARSKQQRDITMASPHSRVVVPCIVIDGYLFRAISAATEIAVKPVSYGHVIFNGYSEPTRVDVVTFRALGQYLDQLTVRAKGWATWAANQTGLTIDTPPDELPTHLR